MKKLRLLGVVCAIVLVLFATAVNAAVLPLESRLDGLAYYDPNLNITWTADANINGPMTWYAAITWVAGLTVGNISGWRLPNMDRNNDGTVVDCFGGGIIGCNDNEYGYLHWEEGIIPGSTAPFSNVQTQPSIYWSSTNFDTTPYPDADPILKWVFGFSDGNQAVTPPDNNDPYAWAVYDGDVAAIPIPAASYLFGSGLLGLIGIARRKKVA